MEQCKFGGLAQDRASGAWAHPEGAEAYPNAQTLPNCKSGRGVGEKAVKASHREGGWRKSDTRLLPEVEESWTVNNSASTYGKRPPEAAARSKGKEPMEQTPCPPLGAKGSADKTTPATAPKTAGTSITSQGGDAAAGKTSRRSASVRDASVESSSAAGAKDSAAKKKPPTAPKTAGSSTTSRGDGGAAAAAGAGRKRSKKSTPGKDAADESSSATGAKGSAASEAAAEGTHTPSRKRKATSDTADRARTGDSQEPRRMGTRVRIASAEKKGF